MNKSQENRKHKYSSRFPTAIQSLTFRTIASRNDQNSVSSSYASTMNNSSLTTPTSITTVNSHSQLEPYLSDFDYRKLSTLTGLTESKVNELHREFLMLSTNGRLTFDQYKSMLEAIPNQNSSIPLEKLARQTFALFDKDGSNYLDFAEFLAAYLTMERNELSTTNSTHSKPKTAPLTPQTTAYSSPHRSLVNNSPSTRYISSHYTSYYQPQISERYLYTSAQYRYR